MIDVDDGREHFRVIVQGNRSASWRANLMLVGALAVVCMGIAIAMATQGFWMIIPFAGLEVLFVAGCLYMTLRRLSRKEIITVEPQAIRVEWGYTCADTSVALPRRWSRLEYDCKDSPFDCGDLAFAAHGKRYALGRCLNRVEKKKLYTELSTALAR